MTPDRIIVRGPVSPAAERTGAHGAGDLRCPKRMMHGPCGGVRPGGTCEVGGACAFVGPGVAVAPRAPASAGATALEALMRQRPIIVADLPSPGPDIDAERRLAAALAGHVDAALLGDSPWARLQLPPSVRAGVVQAEGVRAWAGLNCRDRNRVALRSELAGLAAVGAAAVHCVTGDHPDAHRTVRSEHRGASSEWAGAPGVFDLDSTQLAEMAAQTGLVVSVAESPTAPLTAGRPFRAAAKADAGASVCFVNHAGDAASLSNFVAATRALAPALQIIVCVPMVISRAGADRLAAFLPGALPRQTQEALESRNPAGAAIRAAVQAATAALELDGVGGVDLSAPAGPREELAVAEALASVGAALGGGA